jgi:hypothetical protein
MLFRNVLVTTSATSTIKQQILNLKITQTTKEATLAY